jgi:hypothetical protein
MTTMMRMMIQTESSKSSFRGRGGGGGGGLQHLLHCSNLCVMTQGDWMARTAIQRDRDRERERRERQQERERERQRDRGRERTKSLIVINSNNEVIILQGTFGHDDNQEESVEFLGSLGVGSSGY